MTNLYNNQKPIKHNQNYYDTFNNFIFSKDRNIFNKMWAKAYFYELTKHLHGDIVECGVFKGSGLAVWLKLLNIHEPGSIKQVLGFDYFNPAFVSMLQDSTEKGTMEQVFTRCEATKSDVSREAVHSRLINAGFSEDKFQLIEGGIEETLDTFLETRPGLRISILYLDLDLDKPTYVALSKMWDRVVPGGVIVFDEYAYHAWSESDAVDRFIKQHNITLKTTQVKAPTAYIVK